MTLLLLLLLDTPVPDTAQSNSGRVCSHPMARASTPPSHGDTRRSRRSTALAWGAHVALCGIALARLVPGVHCAPASDRFGAGVGGAEALWQVGGHVLDRRAFVAESEVHAEAVVTQTVFSTLVQTETATTYTTVVSGSGAAGGGASTPAASVSMPSGSGGSPSVPTLSPDVGIPPVPTPASSVGNAGESTSDSGQPTSTSSPDSQPVLFMPPPPPAASTLTDQPPLPTATLLPNSGAESAHSSAPPSSASPTPPPPPSPPPSPPPPAPTTTPKPLMMAYYPDWAASAFPPEKVDFGRYDWVDFAFAVPLSDFTLGWDGSDDAPDLLKRLVASAHQSGKKVKVSVGGWTGSK